MSKIEKLQKKVDDITDVMQDNVHELCKRGENLSDVHTQAEQVKVKAEIFKKEAKSTRRRANIFYRIYRFTRRVLHI